MGTQTPNHSFYKPAINETGWGSDKNSDYDYLDVRLIIKDTFSNRPSAGTQNRWFLATDLGLLYYDDGSSWNLVSIPDVTDGSTSVQATEVTFDSSNFVVTDDGDGTATVNLQQQAGGLSNDTKRTLQTAPITTTELDDTEFISFRVHVPSGNTLRVWAMGVQTNNNTNPAGLTAEVWNESTSNRLTASNKKRVTGDPLGSATGQCDVRFEIENDSGNLVNATGTFSYTIE